MAEDRWLLELFKDGTILLFEVLTESSLDVDFLRKLDLDVMKLSLIYNLWAFCYKLPIE